MLKDKNSITVAASESLKWNSKDDVFEKSVIL